MCTGCEFEPPLDHRGFSVFILITDVIICRYLCARYFLPLILRSPLKTILNLSSISAMATSHGASAYQASKMAMLRLTEFLVSK